MSDEDREVFGTVAPEAPVTRADLERALRGVISSHRGLRDTVLQLAAQVVALTDELARRGEAPALGRATTEALAKIRVADAAADDRVAFDLGEDKYTVTPSTPPCAELLPLCEARCCKLRFSLSTQDLDEGVIRWDYGRPYLIRQRASDGYCSHNDPETHVCSLHEVRPRICRVYDCKDDKRIWADFERRILAPRPDDEDGPPFDLVERARARSIAELIETEAIATSYADHSPVRGPRPPKR